MTTDNGSRTGADGERRALSKDERDFVAAMLSGTPHIELSQGCRHVSLSRSSTAGMESLRFVSDKSRRLRELQIASDEFVDIDGVPVSEPMRVGF